MTAVELAEGIRVGTDDGNDDGLDDMLGTSDVEGCKLGWKEGDGDVIDDGGGLMVGDTDDSCAYAALLCQHAPTRSRSRRTSIVLIIKVVVQQRQMLSYYRDYNTHSLRTWADGWVDSSMKPQ